MSVRFVIPPLDFVRNAGVHCDKIPVFEFARLRNLLFDDDGVVTYQISGYSDKNNRPNLRLEVKGEIHFRCQRCLDKLTHVVELQAFLRLVKNEAELNQADNDDTIDAILATSELDVFDLIEEEIILSLPISSHHPDGKCTLNQPKSTESESNSVNRSQAAHPFAALAKFKKTN